MLTGGLITPETARLFAYALNLAASNLHHYAEQWMEEHARNEESEEAITEYNAWRNSNDFYRVRINHLE